MARIFITGSADGLGQLAAAALIAQGHHVVLHARNAERAKLAAQRNPGADAVLIGDLSSMSETKTLAQSANNIGRFDAVIHNAGIYRESGSKIFHVNTLAPYILTCQMQMPTRLIYLSSAMHMQGHPNLENFGTGADRISYSDSKLHVVMLAFAIAQRYPDVFANAVNPGWVPTKMGGAGAPDNLQKGFETQAWLAVSDDAGAQVSGRYFYHKKEARHNPLADDPATINKFIQRCAEITGVELPG